MMTRGREEDLESQAAQAQEDALSENESLGEPVPEVELDELPADISKENWFARFFELDKHLVEDWIRGHRDLHPAILAAVRLAFALAVGAALVYNFANRPHPKFFQKLTYLSGLALVFYLAIMAWLGFRHGRCRAHWGYLRRFLLNELHFSCWMFQCLIPPIYWLGIYPRVLRKNVALVDWWQDGSVHGLGTLALVVELAMARRWYLTLKDTLVNLTLILMYMFWMILSAWLFAAPDEDGTWAWSWPYAIYRFDFKYAWVVYVGTFISAFLVSFLVVGVHRAKNHFAPHFHLKP